MPERGRERDEETARPRGEARSPGPLRACWTGDPLCQHRGPPVAPALPSLCAPSRYCRRLSPVGARRRPSLRASAQPELRPRARRVPGRAAAARRSPRPAFRVVRPARLLACRLSPVGALGRRRLRASQRAPGHRDAPLEHGARESEGARAVGTSLSLPRPLSATDAGTSDLLAARRPSARPPVCHRRRCGRRHHSAPRRVTASLRACDVQHSRGRGARRARRAACCTCACRLDAGNMESGILDRLETIRTGHLTLIVVWRTTKIGCLKPYSTA